MKTPSRRKKDKKRKTIFKTQLEIDIENGFDASRYEQPSAANYRRVKHAIDKQRRKLTKAIEDAAKKEIEAIAKEKRIKKQARINMKNQTIFDVIDIDD